MNNRTKIGQMPTAEIMEWPGRQLEDRKRQAIIDQILADESQLGKFKVIERTLVSLDLGPVQFAELVLDVMERGGEHPTRWRRIEPLQRTRRRV
jgi:hypothetical protein